MDSSKRERTPGNESGDPTSSTSGPSTSRNGPKDQKDGDGTGNIFECNICLDAPTDPVVSLCGHLFCWPCLHGWLEMKPPGQQTCPVCKAAIDRDKVVPLYGRNARQEDPRKKTVPPRPNAHRTEAPNSSSNDFFFPGMNAGNAGFHMAFGFGALPFTFLTTAFNLGGLGNTPIRPGDTSTVSQLFLFLGVIMILWILFM